MQKCGLVRNWKPLAKESRQRTPSWIRQAFLLAENYLKNRSSFVFPPISSSDASVVDEDGSSLGFITTDLTNEPEAETAGDELCASVASQDTASQNRMENSQIPFLSVHHHELSTNTTGQLSRASGTSVSPTMNSRPNISPVMPNTVAAKEKHSSSSWRPLSRTPAPMVLTECNEKQSITRQPEKKISDACFFETRRTGLDPTSFSIHLSPLYRIIYVDCGPPVEQHKMKTISTFFMPENIYWDRLRTKSAKIMIATIAESSVYPIQWPRPREFTLDVDGICLEHALIPCAWGVKNTLGGLENLNPLSLMYLLLDISKFVETQRVVLTYESKSPASNSGGKFSNQTFRFALFVLEYCDIPRFLAKIETLLEKRTWHDLSMTTHANAEDEDVVCNNNNVVLSLKCPISMLPIRVPVRGNGCTHAQVIDLSSFISHIHQSRQWRCPLCSSEIQCLWDIVIDEGIHGLIEEMRNSGEYGSKATLDSNGIAAAIGSNIYSDQNDKKSMSEESLDECSSLEKTLSIDAQESIEITPRRTDSLCQGDHRATAIEIE